MSDAFFALFNGDGPFTIPQTIPLDELRLHNQLPPDRGALRFKLHEIRHKQAALEMLSQGLDIRRVEYESFAESLEQVLAPCRMVPADLWAIVFAHAPESRWHISWVCRGWRDVALKMPLLWSDIPALGYPTFSPANFLSCLRVQLHRAQRHPLNITALRLPLEFGFRPHDLEEFFAIFHAMIPQIGHLTLEPEDSSLDTAFSFISQRPQHFHQLQTVMIRSRNQRPQNHNRLLPIIQLFASAPNLREMDVNITATSPPFTTWLKIPWTNFTKLSIGWVKLQDMHYILKHTPHLEMLAISTKKANHQEENAIVGPTQHLRLRQLDWLCESRGGLNPFPRFILPAIQGIFIQSTSPRERHLLNMSSYTPDRCIPSRPLLNLTRLFLGHLGDHYSGEVYVKLLQTMPFLEILSTSWTSRMHLLFGALATVNAPGDQLLPSLRHLRLINVPRKELTTQERNTTVQWRVTLNHVAWQRGHGLMLVLSPETDCSAETVAKIQRRSLRHLNEGKYGDLQSGTDATIEEDPAEQVRILIDQLSRYSHNVDDVQYVSARVAQRTRLRELVVQLVEEDFMCQRFVDSILDAQQHHQGTAREITELNTHLQPEDVERLVPRLMQRCQQCHELSLVNPVWKLHTFPRHQNGVGERFSCVIYYARQRREGIPDTSTLLNPSGWRAPVDPCTGEFEVLPLAEGQR